MQQEYPQPVVEISPDQIKDKKTQSKCTFRVVDDELREHVIKLVQTYLIFLYKVVAFLYHPPNTTWLLFCDVIWALPECNTTFGGRCTNIGPVICDVLWCN